jgi:hypothetical protein
LREWPEIATWQAAVGPWRATVTGYDWEMRPGGHASGGAMTMLWHEGVGPVLVASMNRYALHKPTNMQGDAGEGDFPLTARVELTADGRRFANTHDLAPRIDARWDGAATFGASARLVDVEGHDPPGASADCRLDYRIEPGAVTLSAATRAPGARLIVPIVSADGEAVDLGRDGSVRIARPGGVVTLTAGGARFGGVGERAFNHVPGMQAVPLSAALPGGGAEVIIRIA